MKRTMVGILLVLFTLTGFGDRASSVDRPALPQSAEWVQDETNPNWLADALSAKRDVESASNHQRAIHSLVLLPEVRDATFAAFTDKERLRLVNNELSAALKLRALTKPQPKLPQWNVVPPVSVAQLRAAYKAAEKETGIGWEYLAAVNFVETKMGRIRGTSTAGAKGPMQFLPSTWKIYGKGGDIENTNDSIAAAARFLKAKGGPANMSKALFRYNNSNNYVQAVTLYAENLKSDPALLTDYHSWKVIYRWVEGDVYLQDGYTGP
jgi:membrane-bound lytic murein transglycosylase B